MNGKISHPKMFKQSAIQSNGDSNGIAATNKDDLSLKDDALATVPPEDDDGPPKLIHISQVFPDEKTGDIIENSNRRRRLKQCGGLTLITVYNFPPGISERDLFELFQDFNPVKVIIQINLDIEELPTMAQVLMTRKDAVEAQMELNEIEFKGNIIIIEL